MSFLFLFFALSFNALANFLIKLGAIQGNKGLLTLNRYFFLGVLSFAIALYLYARALSRIPLTVAYPVMTGVSFAIILLLSFLFLNEQLSLLQWLGIFFVFSGVFLLAQGTA